jgi:AcrR family transcriptional regulator
MAMARPIDPSTRPALLSAAHQLFYRHGIGPTSIDDVADASGLTKPTLYRYFSSKQALVGAYLDERDAELAAELERRLQAVSPRRKPAAVIDWICDTLCDRRYNGCAFVRAVAEWPGEPGVRERARRRKRDLLAAITSACHEAGVKHPELLARQLALIVEGASTMVYVSGERDATVQATRDLAHLALDQAGLGTARR